jgi:hypothetical protein
MIYQNINDFNNKLVNIINFIGIEGKTNIIGSSILKPIRYNSDYDLSTEITKPVYGNNPKSELNIKHNLYMKFLKLFKESKKDKNIFITDFKCGVDKNGDAIRWKYEDMINGYKNIDDEKYYFIDCLTHKSTIKIDIIYLINCKFTEMSDNYYIKIGNKTNFEKITKDSIINSLEKDYKDLVSQGKYYKALKREFSIIQTNNMNLPTPKDTLNKRQQVLVNYFNSDIGILNKGKADLSVLLILLEEQTFRKVSLKNIRENLQIIKQNISYALDINLSNKLNKATKAGKVEMIKIIKNIIDNLENYINNDAYNEFF